MAVIANSTRTKSQSATRRSCRGRHKSLQSRENPSCPFRRTHAPYLTYADLWHPLLLGLARSVFALFPKSRSRNRPDRANRKPVLVTRSTDGTESREPPPRQGAGPSNVRASLSSVPSAQRVPVSPGCHAFPIGLPTSLHQSCADVCAV